MLNKNQPSYSVGQALPPTRRFSHAGFGQQQQQLHQQHGRENSMNAGSNINQHNSFATSSEDLGPRRRISLYHNMKFTPIAEESSPPPPGRKHSHQREMGLNPNAPTFTMQQQQQYSHRSGRYSRQASQPHYSPPAAAHHQPHPSIRIASGSYRRPGP